MKKIVALFLSLVVISCLFVVPVSAEKYEFDKGYSIEIPDTYVNSDSIYKATDSSVVNNKAWIKSENNDRYILLTQVNKNTDKVNIKSATKSDLKKFELICTSMIGYDTEAETKKEKINGYDAIHLYLNEIKDNNGKIIYGDMYVFSSRNYIYYVYYVYSDKNYSTTSEFSSIIDSFKIKDKSNSVINNVIIYIGVGVLVVILLIILAISKKKKRTIYFNEQNNFNGYQQYNAYNQQNMNQYSNNPYQQNNQQTFNQYGNNTYQQANSYTQPNNYSQPGANNNYSNQANSYGSSTPQNTSEWLSSPSKPVDDNDPNKLADEFWGNK